MKTPPQGYDVIPVDIAPLRKRKIGIIGFGNQAKPWALNMLDSGLEIYAGLRAGSASALSAIMDLIEVLPPDRVAKLCDVICMLIPDELIPGVLKDELFSQAPKGATIVLAHAGSLLFEDITFPENMDAILLAPHGPGETVRKQYVNGNGLPAQWDIIRDSSGTAQQTAFALASALGFATGGLRRIDYKKEAVIDLFSEQAVLVGAMLAAIGEALETLKNAGYDTAVSRVSCIDEIKYTANLFAEQGLDGGIENVSSAAAFGAHKTMQLLHEPLKNAFKQLLDDIESGKFTSALKADSAGGHHAIIELKENLGKLMKD